MLSTRFLDGKIRESAGEYRAANKESPAHRPPGAVRRAALKARDGGMSGFWRHAARMVDAQLHVRLSLIADQLHGQTGWALGSTLSHLSWVHG